MAKISGYEFVISLDARQAINSINTLTSRVRTMKNVMNSNFSELLRSSGQLAAYSQRVADASVSIKDYQDAIQGEKNKLEELRNQQAKNAARMKELSEAHTDNSEKAEKNAKELDGVKTASDKLDKQIASTINRIARYSSAITKQTARQEEDRKAIQRLTTGIDAYRKMTQATATVSESYVKSLRESGHYYRANRANAESLKSRVSALNSQYKAENSVLLQTRKHQQDLIGEYRDTVQSINDLNLKKRTNGSLSREENAQLTQSKMRMSGLREEIGKSSGALSNQAEKVRSVASAYKSANKEAHSLGNTRLGSFVSATSSKIDILKNNTEHLSNWFSKTKDTAGKLATGIAGVGAVTVASVKSAASAQKRFIEVRNLMETSGEKASVAQRNMRRMMSQSTKLSNDYGISVKNIAEQYEELIKRGYSGESAIGSMKSMLQAARASGDDYADVVKVTSTALDAFNLRSEKASTQMRNSSRVANAIASSADRTSSSFQETGVALAYVAGAANTAGYKVEEVSAAIGELSNRGLEGTRAGTGLRKVLQVLTNQANGVNKNFKSIGLTADDFIGKGGKLKSLNTIFDNINKALSDKGYSGAKRSSFFTSVFGATGAEAANDLAATAKEVGNNDKSISALIRHIKDDEKDNYIERLANKNMQSVEYQTARLRELFRNIGIDLGNELLPYVSKVSRELGNWMVSKEGKQSIQDFSKLVGSVAVGITTHLGDITKFADGLIDGFRGAYRFAKPLLTSVSGIFERFSGKSGSSLESLGELSGWLMSAVAASKLLNASLGWAPALVKDVIVWRKNGLFGNKLGAEAVELRAINTELKETNELLANTHGLGYTPSDSAEKIVKDSSEASDTLGQSISAKHEGNTLSKATTRAEYRVAEAEASEAGAKSADKFTSRMSRRLTSSKGKVKWSALFKYGSSAAEEAGGTAGLGWARRLASKIGDKGVASRAKWSSFFKYGGIAGAKEGTSAGAKFLGSVIGKLGAGASVASLGLTIGSSINKAANGKTAKSRGRGAGETLGTVIGAGIGGFFGNVGGAAVGAEIGKSIGANSATIVKTGIGLGKKLVRGIWSGIKSLWGDLKSAWNGLVKGLDAFGSMRSNSAWGQFAMLLSGDAKTQQRGAKGLSKGWRNFWSGWWNSGKDESDDLLGKGKSKRKKSSSGLEDSALIDTSEVVSKSGTRNIKSATKALKDYVKEVNRLKKANAGDAVDKLYRELTKGKNWRSVGRTMSSVASAFRNVIRVVRTFKSATRNPFANFNRSLRQTRNVADSVLNPKRGKSLSGLLKQLKNTISDSIDKKGLFSGLNRSTRQLKNFNNKVDDFKDKINDQWSSMFSTLNTRTKTRGNVINNTAKSNLSKFTSNFKDWKKDFNEAWRNWLKDVNSTFKTSFDKLPGLAQKSMRDIVSKLNRGIKGVNTVIDDYGGTKKLDAIAYAKGTGGHPGGAMIVNDGHTPNYREMVKFPNKPWMMFNARNVLVPNAPAGTQVIDGETSHTLSRLTNIKHYAKGTDDKDKDGGTIKKSTVLKKMLSGFDSGSEVTIDLGTSMAKVFVDSVYKKIKDDTGSIGNVSGNAKAWIPIIKRVAKRMEVNLTTAGLNAILRRINQESGGSATVQNNWDSNAKAGTPSKGLLQYIQPTLDTWAARSKGFGVNLGNGADQIAAMFNDSNWLRDISVKGGWGPTGHKRFANGGIVSTEQLVRVAEGNQPEAIIPLAKSKRSRATELVHQVVQNFASDDSSQPSKNSTQTANVEALLTQTYNLMAEMTQYLQTIADNSANPVPAVVSANDVTKAVNRKNKIDSLKKQLLG